MTVAVTLYPPPLPDTLRHDLEELLTWDNNCYLTWIDGRPGADREDTAWFTVRFLGSEAGFTLRQEFWIPDWMHARAVEAVLPARYNLCDCDPGKQAAFQLPEQRLSGLRREVPGLSRVIAGLLQTLWGPVESGHVLLLALYYQTPPCPQPFRSLPAYDP